MEELYMEFHL